MKSEHAYLESLSVNHFEYRDGVLHAEDVAVPDIAAAVGTPFYCYSTATLTRHYTVFAKAFAGTRRAGPLRHEGESNQAVLRVLAKLGAGADVVSEGEMRRALAAGIPAKNPVFRRRQDRAGDGFRAFAGIPASTSNPNRSWNCCRPAPRRWARRAGLVAHQPGCRCQDAPEDLYRQGREQVRHSMAARTRCVRQGCRYGCRCR